jgi:hypothetical protein
VFRGVQLAPENIARIEKETLQAVCATIQTMLNDLTHADCLVTIKLIFKEGSGSTNCETYVRSQPICGRDEGGPRRYEVGTGANTAFDMALHYSEGVVSCFFSPDLTREKNYRNQRPNWEEYYRSCLVVPIRYIAKNVLVSRMPMITSVFCRSTRSRGIV